MEAIIKERNDLLEKNNDLVEEVYALRANNLLYREGGRQLREQVIRLQNHINSLRKANIVCDMQLRKDLAETLFDKKSDIPDGIYLELMNKLRI
jgi:predicted nuclease with TOPRIM domain